jgi:hypothetical protein
MRSGRAAKAGSAVELRQAWALAQRGLSALLRAVFGGAGVEGLQTVADTVDPALQSSRIDDSDLQQWVDRLFLSWGEQLARFRRHGGSLPSMEAALGATSSYMTYSRFAAAAAEQLAAKWERKTPTFDKEEEGGESTPPKTPKKRNRGKRKRPEREKAKREETEREETVPPSDTAAECGLDKCWPGDKSALQGGKWQQAMNLAKKAFPGHCAFWMLSEKGCNKGSACTRKHEKPANFQSEVIAKVKLE